MDSCSPTSQSPAGKIDVSKQLAKTKMCMHYVKGRCRYGLECSYAHADLELRGRPDLRKTRLCKNFELGKCYDPDCAFAHGAGELRGTDGVWKTVLCTKWTHGACRAGTRCRFAHGQHELREEEEETPVTQFSAAPATYSGFNRFAALGSVSSESTPDFHPMSDPFDADASEDQLKVMASLVQMISDFDANDPMASMSAPTAFSSAFSLAGSAGTPPPPAPPAPPAKWGSNEEPAFGSISSKHFPPLSGLGRPVSPLRSVSPAAMNCLPPSLFSPSHA